MRIPASILAFGAFGALTILGASAGSREPVTGQTTGVQGNAIYHPVRLVRGKEIKSATSYRNSSETVVSGNKHVLALIYKYQSGYDTSGAASDEFVESTTGTTGPVEMSGASLEDPPPVTTAGTTGTTTSTTSSTTTGGTTGSTGGSSEVYLMVSGGEFGVIPQAPSRMPTTSVTNIPGFGRPPVTNSLFYRIYPGDEIPVHLAADGPLSGGSIAVTIWTQHQTLGWVGNTTGYTITKQGCGDAAVDTRKAHGQPNLDGELPGDPNADPRPINFGTSKWKGGLFVGNMLPASGDQSGYSRIQLWPGVVVLESDPQPRMVVLSLLHLGAHASANGSVTIGAFQPASNDSNLTKTEGNVTWETKWNIAPRGTVGNPPDYTQDPIRKASAVPLSSPEYLNWSLTTVKDVYVQIIGGYAYDTQYSTPLMSMQKVALAAHNETAWVGAGNHVWRYFASKEYEPDRPNEFPFNDSKPRMWFVNISTTSTWP